MLFTNIFISKIIHRKGEGNQAGFMFPKPGGVDTFVIPMGDKSLPQESVGQNPCLGESPHSLSDLQENKAVSGMNIQTVLLFYLSIQGTMPMEFSYTILEIIQGDGEIKKFKSRHIYFAPTTLKPLFQRSFDMVRSTVRVGVSPL
jgi:hypothetical protein